MQAVQCSLRRQAGCRDNAQRIDLGRRGVQFLGGGGRGAEAGRGGGDEPPGMPAGAAEDDDIPF